MIMVKFLLLSLTALIIVSSAAFAADPVKLTDYQMSKIQGAAARANNAAIARSVLGATAGVALPAGLTYLPSKSSASAKDINTATAALIGATMLIAAPAIAVGYSSGVVTDYGFGYAECSLRYGGVLKPGVSKEDAANRDACVGKVAEKALTNPWNVLGGVAAGTSIIAKVGERTAAKAVQSGETGYSIILAHKFDEAMKKLDLALKVKDVAEIFKRSQELYTLFLNNSGQNLASVDTGQVQSIPVNNAAKPKNSGGSSGSGSGSSGSSSSGSSGSSSSSSGSTSSGTSRTSSGFGSSPSTTVSTAARTVVSSTGSLRDYSPEMARAIALR